MRTTISRLLLLFVLLVASIASVAPGSLAQDAGPESTPGSLELGGASTPAADGTPAASQAPVFGMVAVGDHPSGFFQDVQIEPGSSTELTVAIINAGEVPVTLSTYKVNALAAVNGSFLAGEQDDPPIGATAWLDYPTQEIRLEPGQQQEITFTVTVPEGTSPGQYVSGLFATATDAAPIPGSDILRQLQGYAISVSILVPGEITPSFTLGEPEIVQSVLTIPVTNTGNYLVRPAGEVTLHDAEGTQVHTSAVEMGSVYAGLSTTIEVSLPDQLAPGDYTMSLSLTDEVSGAAASLSDTAIVVPVPVDPTGISATVSVEPNADPIAFANVTVNVQNGGERIGAADVTLNVLFNGETVESFPVGTNVVLEEGETIVTDRYIPATDWQSGTYSFQLVISAVGRAGGSETILFTLDVADEIVIP